MLPSEQTVIVIPSVHTAHEIIMRVPEWRPGDVVRAHTTIVTAGGKPLNVARFAARMGGDVRVPAAADSMLAERIARDPSLPRIELTIVTTRALSRTDVTLADADGRTTVITGEPSTLDRSEEDRLIARLRRGLGAGDHLVIAGTLPGPAPIRLLERLIDAARRAAAELIVDVSGPLLVAALEARPSIVKVTAGELAAARGVDAAQAWQAGRELAPEPGSLVVTDGSRGLRAWLSDGSMLEAKPPAVRAVTTLGAGDAMTAGVAVALDGGGSLADGLLLGTAMAAARIERLEPDFDPTRARELLQEVRLIAVG